MPKDSVPQQSFWKTIPGILTGIASLITAVGGFILIMSQVGVCNRTKSGDAIVRTQKNDTSGPTQVKIATRTDNSLSAIAGGITYTVLSIRAIDFSTSEDRLILTIKVSVGTGSGGMSFSAEHFRLEVDGVKIAPASGGSSHFVPENAEWKEDVEFVVPKTISLGNLWVGHIEAGKSSRIPIKWK